MWVTTVMQSHHTPGSVLSLPAKHLEGAALLWKVKSTRCQVSEEKESVVVASLWRILHSLVQEAATHLSCPLSPPVTIGTVYQRL